MAKAYERRRLRNYAEGRRFGDIHESDLRRALSFALEIGIAAGVGHVLGIEGETRPQLGLLAITVNRKGELVGMLIPDETHTGQVYAIEIAQSNPRRRTDDADDGA